jgi:hypothetical protein
LRAHKTLNHAIGTGIKERIIQTKGKNMSPSEATRNQTWRTQRERQREEQRNPAMLKDLPSPQNPKPQTLNLNKRSYGNNTKQEDLEKKGC